MGLKGPFIPENIQSKGANMFMKNSSGLLLADHAHCAVYLELRHDNAETSHMYYNRVKYQY